MSDTTDTTPTAPTAGNKRAKGGRPPGSRNRATVAAEQRAAAAAASTAVAGSISGPAPKSTGRPSNAGKMREAIFNLYTSAGAMLKTFGMIARQPNAAAIGAALVENADSCATALMQWAEVNPRVKSAIEAMATAGGAGVVLAAHAPILMAALNPPPLDELPDLGAIFANLGGTPA